MWLLVLFDLPATTRADRWLASRFRNALLARGFERLQLSVYTRRCPGAATTLAADVRRLLPASGSACLIELTDLQYEGLVRLQGGEPLVFEKPKRLISF